MIYEPVLNRLKWWWWFVSSKSLHRDYFWSQLESDVYIDNLELEPGQ